jgi:hypothetical protein
LALLESPA